MFGSDPDIKIEYDDKRSVIKLFVNNSLKASALDELLPLTDEGVIFGNVPIYVIVIPDNDNTFVDTENMSAKELYDAAFERNPVYAFSKTIQGEWSFNCTYVVFKNKVVQFFNDNLNDLHGNISTLYENIARDIFVNDEMYPVFYCTDIEEKIGKPLGEWP